MNRALFNELTWYVVLVSFRTNSGNIRQMRCTRNAEHVPENLRPGINDPRLTGPSIVSVWDLDNNGWRAFRWDAVISHEITDGN